MGGSRYIILGAEIMWLSAKWEIICSGKKWKCPEGKGLDTLQAFAWEHRGNRQTFAALLSTEHLRYFLDIIIEQYR